MSQGPPVDKRWGVPYAELRGKSSAYDGRLRRQEEATSPEIIQAGAWTQGTEGGEEKALTRPEVHSLSHPAARRQEGAPGPDRASPPTRVHAKPTREPSWSVELMNFSDLSTGSRFLFLWIFK